jgi:hypothetical protein
MEDHPEMQAKRRARSVLLPLALLICAPAGGSAQTDAVVAGGGGLAAYRAVDEMAGDSIGFALIYRIGQPQGFRPTFGFNWYSTAFDGFVGGERVDLGDLRIRPVMGGYGYWWTRGRATLAATLIGGVAFNTFDTSDQARIAYNRRLDELLLRVDASHGLAARAELGLWYDLSDKAGLLGSIGYVAARPKVEIITETSRSSTRLRADAVKLQIGVVYAPL